MNRRTRYGILAVILVAALGYMVAQQSSLPTVTAQETYGLLNDSTVLILDVRTMPEHIGARIKNAPLIPVQELERRIHELDPYQGKKIIVYCRTANRSAQATSILRERGFDAYNMSGGIVRWKSESLPVISGAVQ